MEFLVNFDLPEGVTAKDALSFLKDAIVTTKSQDMDHPICRMKDDDFKVTVATPIKKISRVEALEFIHDTSGKFFSVRFIKRTTGEIREMLARTGVQKDLKHNPERPGIDFKKNDLIGVWDVQADGYRSIPKEGIVAIMIKGHWHQVIE